MLMSGGCDGGPNWDSIPADPSPSPSPSPPPSPPSPPSPSDPEPGTNTPFSILNGTWVLVGQATGSASGTIYGIQGSGTATGTDARATFSNVTDRGD